MLQANSNKVKDDVWVPIFWSCVIALTYIFLKEVVLQCLFHDFFGS